MVRKGTIQKYHRTYNSVGSTESGYLTCLDSTVKRDLLCSLSFPNRTSPSSSTNAESTDEYPSGVGKEGRKACIFLSGGILESRW
jgi:hypothetical protein